jgi:hypothetical protein
MLKHVARLSVFMLACAFGCQGPPLASSEQALDPIASSGTRLKFQYSTSTYTTTDGASYTQRGDVVPVDTKYHNHPCEFVNVQPTGAPPMWYCLPLADGTLDGSYPGRYTEPLPPRPSFPSAPMLFYSDAGCSQPVGTLYDPSGATDTTYLFMRAPAGSFPVVYNFGAEVTKSTIYWRNPSGSASDVCTATTNPDGPGWRLFEANAAGSDFPAVTRTDSVATE